MSPILLALALASSTCLRTTNGVPGSRHTSVMVFPTVEPVVVPTMRMCSVATDSPPTSSVSMPTTVATSVDVEPFDGQTLVQVVCPAGGKIAPLQVDVARSGMWNHSWYPVNDVTPRSGPQCSDSSHRSAIACQRTTGPQEPSEITR